MKNTETIWVVRCKPQYLRDFEGKRKTPYVEYALRCTKRVARMLAKRHNGEVEKWRVTTEYTPL